MSSFLEMKEKDHEIERAFVIAAQAASSLKSYLEEEKTGYLAGR